MIDQVIVIDNVVPLDIQESIKKELLESLFPWFYKSTLSANTENIKGFNPVMAPGFGHVFYNNYGAISKFYDSALPIIEAACKRINFPMKEMMFGRTFLQLPLANAKGVTNPHIDAPGVEHLVCVYYVVDADGDTVIFDKKHSLNPDESFENIKIVQRVTPRQGSVLLFNGNTYHANMLPQEHLRCIINFNVR